MKFLQRLIVLIPLYCGLISSGQDTSRYCQENGVLFSNCYDLVRTHIGAKTGTFTQRIATNDGQVFYGWGIFKENKSSIELTFSKVNTYPKIFTKHNKTFSDTLYIQWYSRDNAQEFFKVEYQDSTIDKVYKSEKGNVVVKIPKAELKDTKLSIYQGNKKIVDFIISDTRADNIIIYAEDPRQKYLFKYKEKLVKTLHGFAAKGVYTKENTSNFNMTKIIE
jgi:hypothetical protein